MRTVRWIVTVLAVVALTAAAGHAQVRGMGRINGVVVDDGGAPIEGVTIRTATAAGDLVECATDAKGHWALGGIGRGDWQVTVLKPGFVAKRLKVTVEREIDRSQEIKITLAKAS